ncbi:MFS transporter [Pseudotabrizicola formosa]|uniref:MFS transporter n=1 Tax=Pseudotabrizicola formosa TaxID=2030009 RepID=UPI000CD2B63F|nr:MFS transporter [Pseudotabrizicola formosa]
MLTVLRNTWALLLGLGLLMLGNGMQGTLLGIRGGIENFSTFQMSLVMSAYFVGFLFGSRLAPLMIRRVGHVRVFAALGSLISAVLILYAAAPDWMIWAALRVIIGFSFSGVYIATESWLNNASTNENRGQALSLYLIVQMIGIIAAQLLLNVGDASGYILFVIPSVLVSLAFTPILLSASPAPAFDSTKPMSFRRLYEASPLGCVGMFLLGGVFSAQFGMASVWGTQAGLSIADLTIFVSAIYVGGLVLQYPTGWLSDRIDRRIVVLWLAVLGAVALMIPVLFDPPFWVLVGVGAICGGVSNPLYSLLLAYVNDYLDKTDMAAASAGLMFINGLGAISGPVITGWMMGVIGPSGFFLFMGILFAVLALYTVWRMTQRRETPMVTSGYTPVSPTASVVAVETAAMVEAEDAQQVKARN